MSALLIACLVFVCLAAASLGSLLLHDRLPPHHRPDDTQGVIRLLANIFVVMTSLVLGLMITSAKSRYDAVGRDVHAYATDLILLDRTLLHYGPQADDARSRLRAYVERAADGRWTAGDPVLVSDRTSEQLLRDVGDGIRDIGPAGAEQTTVWNDARQQHRRIVEMRWALVERAEGSIPMPLLGMVIAWLMLIFGSFGYKAPTNVVVTVGFVVSSALIAGALYLILDMDSPFEGTIKVSQAPLQRALAEMQR